MKNYVNYVKKLCELCGKEKDTDFLTHRKPNRVKNYVNYVKKLCELCGKEKDTDFLTHRKQ